MATTNGDKLLNKIKNNLDTILEMIDEDTTDDARLDTVRDIINEAFYKTLDLVPSHLR